MEADFQGKGEIKGRKNIWAQSGWEECKVNEAQEAAGPPGWGSQPKLNQ